MFSQVRFLCPTTIARVSFRSYKPTYYEDDSHRVQHFMKKMMGRKSQKDLLFPKEIISSKGMPTFLTACKGNSKTIKRRQMMLNKHFMQGISDVLAFEEGIGKVIKENNVTITHICVGQHYNHLNIFWTTSQLEYKKVEASLNALIPTLTGKLIERNFMGNIPVIRFCFDTNQINTEMLDKAFSNLAIKSDPTAFTPPTKDATGYVVRPMGAKRWAKRVAKFNEQFKEEQESTQQEQLAMKMNYKYNKFEAPKDMSLDFAGLDYENCMNRVCEQLRRIRSKTLQSEKTEPLPPAHWVEGPSVPPPDHLRFANDPKATTEYRLKSMKDFIVGNRKKKNYVFKVQAREKEEHIAFISDNLNEARDRIQAKDEEYFHDLVEEKDDLDEDLWQSEDSRSQDEK